MHGEFYTDAEVDAMTDGLEQNAAKIRYLRTVCKLRVDRKPNGRPLAWRPDPAAAPAQNASEGQPNRAALLQVIKGGRRGAQTQGR